MLSEVIEGHFDESTVKLYTLHRITEATQAIPGQVPPIGLTSRTFSLGDFFLHTVSFCFSFISLLIFISDFLP